MEWIDWSRWFGWLSEVDPTTWWALGLGFFPLGVLGTVVCFEVRVAKQPDLASHPFVRFPVSAVVGALLGGWSAGVAGWAVLAACGTLYLGSHFFDLVRRERGVPTLELPREYDFSPWPAAAVFTWTALSGYAYAFGYFDGRGATPWELARNLQVAYGGYYLGCYAAYRRPDWLNNSFLWAGFPGGALIHREWKNLSETARVTVATTTIAATASLGAAYGAFQNEKRKIGSEHNREMFKLESEHNRKMFKLENKFNYKTDRLKFEQEKHLADIQQVYDSKGYSYSLVNGRFENVRKEWFWNRPVRVVEPAPPPPGPVPVDKDDVTMSSPLEPGELLGVDWYHLLPATAAVVVLVLTVWFFCRSR